MKSFSAGRIIINSLTEISFCVCQFTNLLWEVRQVDVNAGAGSTVYAPGEVGHTKPSHNREVAWRAWRSLLSVTFCSRVQNTFFLSSLLDCTSVDITFLSAVCCVQFPCTLPTIDLITLLNICQSDAYKMKVHCYFNLQFLSTTKFEYFFMYCLFRFVLMWIP